MTIYEEVKRALIKSYKARERSQKNKFVAFMLYQKYPVALGGLKIEKVEDIIVDAASYDRAWRKILQDNPELRGTDYGDKDELEEKKKGELGYKEQTP